jgi:rod shape-determining protein MreC
MAGRGSVSHGARFVLLAIVALGLMIVDYRDNHLRRVRILVDILAHPIHLVADLPVSAWQAVTGAVAERSDLMRENLRLERQLLISEYHLQRLEALESENDRLRELLNSLEEETESEVSIAEILSVDLDNRQNRIINRGQADGVYTGQPLLDAYGVVGQVTDVYPLSSKAMLITDPDHALHVRIERTQVGTIAEGGGDNGLLVLPYITNTEDVVVGDRLLTSGLGGIYPRGRPVAEIIEVEMQPELQFARVIARPIAAIYRDQEVLLVWSNDPRQADDSTAALLEGVR